MRFAEGHVSAPAVVALLDALRSEVRDRRSKRIDRALAELDGETEVGLWLLETLNKIEAAELALQNESETAPLKTARDRHEAPTEAEEVRTLSYEEFIAGRHLRSEGGNLVRSSFAGSDVGYVRGFLNRLLSFGETAETSETDKDFSKAFETGDEVQDGASSIEEGFQESGLSGSKVPPQELEDLKRQRKAKRRRGNRSELIKATDDHAKSLKFKAEGEGLKAIDILRLRAFITVLAAAGWDGKEEPESVLQVLPPAGDKDATWPRLIGKALFAHFGGKTPLIHTLNIEDYYDQIPDDILECWATCMWASNASLIASEAHFESETLRKALHDLRDRIYRHTGLRAKELDDPRVIRVLDAMNERFAERLGLEGKEVRAQHQLMAKALGQAA